MIARSIRRAAGFVARKLISDNKLHASGGLIEPLETRRMMVVLFVNGTPFNDTVVYDADQNFIYASMNGVMVPQSTAIFDSVLIRTFDGDDHIVINNTTSGDVRIEPGNGLDSVEITPGSKDLDNIQSAVFLLKGSDSIVDSLLIDDRSDAGNDTYEILEDGFEPITAPMELHKGGNVKVMWQEENIGTTVLLNEDDNTVNIQPTAVIEGSHETLLVGGLGGGFGGGNDTVNFNGRVSADNTFRFNGGTGSDVLNVNGAIFGSGDAQIIMDGGNSTGDALNINDPTNTDEYVFNSLGNQLNLFVNASEAGRYQYIGTELISISSTSATEAANYVVNGLGTSTDLTINAGAGADSLTLGDGSMSTADFGTEVDITFNGQADSDHLIVNDASTTAARTHTVGSLDTYDNDAFGLLSYDSFSTAVFNFGSGADDFTAQFNPGIGAATVNGNGGTDTFTVTPDLSADWRLNGNAPTTAPGDTLVINSGALLDGEFTPNGAGAGTIDYPARAPIVFSGMENFPQPGPSATAADLSAGNDTGVSNTDNITNATSLSFSGSGAAANSTTKLYRNGTEVASTTANGVGAYSFANVAFPTGDATFAMTVRYLSGPNNLLSPSSSVLNVRVDTITPATPAAPDLAAASDSGLSNTDNITNDSTPLISGSVSVNDIVLLFEGATQLGSDATTSGGTYAITSAALANGVHNLVARVADIAGNQSGNGPALAVTIDTVAPALAPSTPDLAAASDSGLSNTDNITNDSTPTFTFTAPERVRLLEGATILADFALPASVTSSVLADGVHAINARSVDVAGNVSVAFSADLSVTIDTVAPVNPASAPDLTAASDSGISSTDNITNDTTPTFVGTVPANEIVRLLADGGVVGSDTSTTTGAYSITLPVLSDGNRLMQARFEDVAGNASALGPSVILTIDTVAPATPTSAPDLASSSDSGISNSDNVTNDNTPLLIGQAPGNTVVRLRAGGVEVGFDQVLLLETSYAITSSRLADGTNLMTVVHEDVAGNASPAGPVLGIRIDTVAPDLNSSQFNFETGQSLAMNFSESVAATLSLSDLIVQNLTAGTLPDAQLALGFAGNTATLSFPGVPGGVLADGNYRILINSNGVSDVAGNLLTPAAPFGFFVFAGDANRDRLIDIADFAALAGNFNTAGTFSDGDFDYSGLVDIGDFSVLASKFNQSLPAARPAAGLPVGVFADSKIESDRDAVIDLAGEIL